ncbi:MAG: PadR family transcriptional regulator [Methanoculleus horonobensis]|nr:PadR family transcriptional regulator [Methanoculleus horonobensis]
MVCTLSETNNIENAVLLSHLLPPTSLLLYSKGVNKYHYFVQYLYQGLQRSEHCLYAYYHTRLRTTLQSDIRAGKISVLELQNSIDKVPQSICRISEDGDESQGIRCLLDFSRIDDMQKIMAVKHQILQMQDASLPISALLAFDISAMTDAEVSEIIQGMPNATIMTVNETIVSFRSNSLDLLDINLADRTIVEDMVKRLLEPLILSCLARPVSGYDILREINEHFHVLVPMARIYSYLYDLEKRDFLETRTEGRSKVYVATPAGEDYIRRKKQDIFAILKFIIEDG